MITRRSWMAAGAAALRAQTIDPEIREMAANPPLSMRFAGGDANAHRAWQARFRAKLRELLGEIDPPPAWQLVEESRVDMGDHERRSVLLRAPGQRDVPVHVLTPKQPGKRPAVLALHGHGKFGNDPIVGIAETDEQKKSMASANYSYGLELVKRGFVVAAPCFTPFGRRLGNAAAYKGEDPCGVTFIRMQLFGRVLMGENLRDALWTLAMLSKHERVDANRMACVGLSYGGRMTMLTAAMSDQIRVAVCSGALNVMQERVRGRYSCGAQIIPGLLRYGDVPEIGALIAPRPCVWEVGQRDALMVKDWIEPALARMRPSWKAHGRERDLLVDSFDGGHRWNGAVARSVLDPLT